MSQFIYNIAGKNYIQRKLVLGQYQQLLELLKGVLLPADLDTTSLIFVIGDKMPKALAIILTPEGVSPKDKDLNAVEAEMFNTDVEETTFKVIEDFFDCNDIRLLLKKFNQVMTNITDKMAQEIPETS